VVHEALVREVKNIWSILIRKPEGKETLGRFRSRQEKQHEY
jgi:hypothetical protein